VLHVHSKGEIASILTHVNPSWHPTAHKYVEELANTVVGAVLDRNCGMVGKLSGSHDVEGSLGWELLKYCITCLRPFRLQSISANRKGKEWKDWKADW
jgi:hypothetical protein